MPFLPDDYTPPETSGKFFKPKSGENHVRILTDPILGWVGWTADKKPTPVRREQPDFKDCSGELRDAPRHFWSLAVWNYDAKRVQVWEITQGTIQTPIRSLSKKKAWGDPKSYDLIIDKSGEGMETEYTVQPMPHSPLPDDAKVAWEKVRAAGFDLRVLFDNLDPFADAPKPKAKAAKDDDTFNEPDSGGLPF